MPSWRGKLTDHQIWQLAAYVRTFSGQERKDAVGARPDAMSSTPPKTQTVREPIMSADRPAMKRRAIAAALSALLAAGATGSRQRLAAMRRKAAIS